ncbi:MAG: hypothetical protein ACREP9_08815 [Candidatus Dormibacteraceae bacterium]
MAGHSKAKTTGLYDARFNDDIGVSDAEKVRTSMQHSTLQLMQLALNQGGFALLGALLGAIITGLYSLRSKQTEYVNDYYKKVIDRRMAAYEQLENLIVSLRTVALGEDKKPYHLLFSQDETSGLLPAYQMLHSITSQSLWLSDEAFDKARELDRVLCDFKGGGSNLIEFGQRNYQTLAGLRENLERILATDMLGLHDVGWFLRKKKTRPDPGFQPWG